ncbi:MBL fold metallo-hydrolase [Aquibacillus albus]|uniref:Ribonuclease BN (tRNA processing enzyme) n=1 Tax=Aquibacillus albus TaxID=1168171 RepID=A0ABS2N010_9BACI|nr:MBL fold metallo-hydrolase [Aquibacillus albus]MBM7571472.1 ribonuclease BN (tRNA processing enzyme) [Aquibacillus albus]
MKLTIIGYWGAYPEQGSATSCFLLEKEGFSCLIDCGSGALSRLPSFTQIMELDAVILSHYHHDHIADIGVLQYSWLVQNSIHQTSQILPIYGHAEDQEAFQKLTHQFTKGIAYDPNQKLRVGPFELTFLKTNHPVPCYAMRITDGQHKIVYTADTSYMDGLIPFSKGADLLLTECSFYEDQDGTNAGHLNSKQCAEIAKRAEVNEMILSHHPHFGDRRQLIHQSMKYFDGPVLLAEEGLVWQSY